MKFYVECTHTCGTDLNTGIQRVVRNLVKYSLQNPQRETVPVVFEGDKFYQVDPVRLEPPPPKQEAADEPPARPNRFIRALITYGRNVFRTGRLFIAALLPFPPLVRFLSAPHTQPGLSRLLLQLARRLPPPPADLAIQVEPGDVLVMLDASWHLNVWVGIEAFKRRGGKVVWVAYDLIPNSHPQFCEDALTQAFNRWIEQAMRQADVILAISRATADVVQSALPQGIQPRISYFWLGSELDGTEFSIDAMRPQFKRLAEDADPVYLYVGTVEPRKNHGYVLDAFEQLWRQGSRAKMAIIGRVGWHCDALIERVLRHPQFGDRLFMYNDATDNELKGLYHRARGLLFTSFIEGFGLPIVEALQQGLPVFASDIPAFREIGIGGVTFVDLGSPSSLADAIAGHVAAGSPRLAAPVRWLSWPESTAQFWQRLDNCLAEAPDRRVLVEA